MTVETRTRELIGDPSVSSVHRRPDRWEWVALGVVLLALMVSVGRLLEVGAILGHDEAAYASRARSWVEHTATTSWFPHRSPGLPVLGVGVLALGGGAVGLRLIGLAFAVGLAIGVWVLARRLGGPAAAPVAAAAVAFAPPFLDHAGLFLTDLPATALIVWLMLVVCQQAERDDGPGPGLLWAAPLAAAAVWLRMGAVLPLGLVALGGCLLWPRQVVGAGRWVVATAGLTVGLLWLHFAGAVEAFGTPWGRILYTAELTRTDDPGSALTAYVGDFPNALAGTPAAVLMAVGLLGAVVLLMGRRVAPRPVLLVLLVAIGHFVAMGISSEPDVRFILLPIALLCVLGGVVVGRLAGLLPGAATPAAALTVAGLFLVVGAGPTTAELVAERAANDERYDAMRAAADRIVEGSDEASCAVLTSYVPQVEWLTGCAAAAFGNPPTAAAREKFPSQEAFVLLLRDGKRQPEGTERDALLEGASLMGEWDMAEGRIGAGELYRLP